MIEAWIGRGSILPPPRTDEPDFRPAKALRRGRQPPRAPQRRARRHGLLVCRNAIPARLEGAYSTRRPSATVSAHRFGEFLPTFLTRDDPASRRSPTSRFWPFKAFHLERISANSTPTISLARLAPARRNREPAIQAAATDRNEPAHRGRRPRAFRARWLPCRQSHAGRIGMHPDELAVLCDLFGENLRSGAVAVQHHARHVGSVAPPPNGVVTGITIGRECSTAEMIGIAAHALPDDIAITPRARSDGASERA